MRWAKNFYEVCFAVEGFGPFPLDMLRYDARFPATEADVRAAVEAWNRRALLTESQGTDFARGFKAGRESILRKNHSGRSPENQRGGFKGIR